MKIANEICQVKHSVVLIIITAVISGVFFGCEEHKIPNYIAINQAGNNGKELKAVIKHYRKNEQDSLKLKAAYFIIENLDGLVTLDSTSTAKNNIYFDLLNASWNNNGKIMFSKAVRAIDSVNQKLDKRPTSPRVRYLREPEIVSAEFLINNIEEAFFAWENFPWAKSVSFENFCEYILPYRCTNTYTVNARDYFLRNKDAIMDSAKNDPHNPFVAGKSIVNSVDFWFKEDVTLLTKFPYLYPITFSNLLKGKMGPCIDANSVRVTALRSLGVPAALDEIPNWGNNSSPHFFYRIVDHAHDTITHLITNENVNRRTQHIISASSYDIQAPEGIPPHIQVHYVRTIPKVYRRCFSKQKESLPAIKSRDDEIPTYFNDVRLKDVTNEYLETANVRIELNNKMPEQKYGYLCVFDNEAWRPVAWTRIINGQATFERMGKNIVYLPAYYYHGDFIPAANPFLLTLKGSVKEIAEGVEREPVTLVTKFAVTTFYLNYATYMLGGRFQLANKSDLSDSVTVHTIESLPFYRTEFSVKETKPYRYLIYQFKGVPKTYISELEFFGLNKKGQEVKLRGKLIGNPGEYPYVADKLIDSLRFNLFKAKENSDTYIGIDLGEHHATRITRIRYMPYGDDNGVITGDSYELFYWKESWVSAGVRKANANNTVVFDNIPKGALLLLKNTGGGTQQRIFTYKNGRQEFW